jgi:L-amino acid N-acyltransferase YncA
MNNLVIRPSAAADIAAITEIYADAVINGTASFELEPPTERDMAARRSALVEGGFPYLVAERARRRAGESGAPSCRPWSTPPRRAASG